MSSVPASILGLLNAGSASGNNAGKEARDGFSALLDIGKQMLDAQESEDKRSQKRKEETDVVPVAVPPVVFSTEQDKQLDIRVTRGEEVKADLIEGEAKPFAPREKEINPRDIKNPFADKQAEAERNGEQPIVKQAQDAKPVTAAEKETVETVDTAAPAADAFPVDEAPAVTPENTPLSIPAQIQALVEQFMRDIQQAVQSGNPGQVFSLLDKFHVDLQKIIASVQPKPQPAIVTGNAQANATLVPAGDENKPAVAQSAAPVLTGAAPAAANELAEAALLVPDTQQPSVTPLPLPATPAQAAPAVKTPIDTAELLAKLKTVVALQQDEVKKHAPKIESTDPVVAEVAKNTLLKQMSETSNAIKALLPEKEAPVQQAAPAIVQANAAAAIPVATTNNNAVTPHQQAAAAQVINAVQETGANNSGGDNANSGSKEGQPQAAAPIASTLSADATSKSSPMNFAKLVNQKANEPVAEQVAFHIKTAIKDGSSKIHIQLNPVELGKLDIKLHLNADGKTGVVVTADNKETLALLQKDAGGLERALADAGLKTDAGSLSFNLRGGQQGRDNDHSQAANSYLKSRSEEEEILPNVIAKSYIVNLAEGLDIKI